jgi:hypothetical protein
MNLLERSPPGVNFTNIFTRRFYAHSSQKRKSQSSRQYLFTLLGSAGVKAVCRTLMKLSPGVNFTNLCEICKINSMSEKRHLPKKLLILLA